MKEREAEMEEFDIGNACIDIDDPDHAIFHKAEELDGEEIEEAFNKGGHGLLKTFYKSHELSKTFYTGYDEKHQL